MKKMRQENFVISGTSAFFSCIWSKIMEFFGEKIPFSDFFENLPKIYQKIDPYFHAVDFFGRKSTKKSTTRTKKKW
jgi:hypothetical protein